MLYMNQERVQEIKEDKFDLWKSKPSNRFSRAYNNLSDEMAKRVDEAIETLLSSERPELFGVQKTGSRKNYFAWEFGRACRLLFRPEYAQRVIEFFRVCSHKEAYGP